MDVLALGCMQASGQEEPHAIRMSTAFPRDI